MQKNITQNRPALSPYPVTMPYPSLLFNNHFHYTKTLELALREFHQFR